MKEDNEAHVLGPAGPSTMIEHGVIDYSWQVAAADATWEENSKVETTTKPVSINGRIDCKADSGYFIRPSSDIFTETSTSGVYTFTMSISDIPVEWNDTPTKNEYNGTARLYEDIVKESIVRNIGIYQLGIGHAVYSGVGAILEGGVPVSEYYIDEVTFKDINSTAKIYIDVHSELDSVYDFETVERYIKSWKWMFTATPVNNLTGLVSDKNFSVSSNYSWVGGTSKLGCETLEDGYTYLVMELKVTVSSTYRKDVVGPIFSGLNFCIYPLPG